MKIYNTMTKGKEEFIPVNPGEVRMYVCGPTVYNFIHIGNARPMIVFDTVRRYFEYKGYKVNFVSNFTDVDDKIIKKAIEEGTDADTVSKRYIAECKKDMEGMNIKPATKNPLATEEINGMLEMIRTLIEKGYAYVAKDGTVYFRVRNFKDYGKLSHKNLDDLQSGFREIKVRGEEDKEDANDFVLWKPKKEGEPYWESPWCNGRPGWHIECSVMAKRYLGEEIDIHAGGEDLVFPHHENEIAQSEAANGKKFARYWMQNAFMLSAHYRSPLTFSAELMEASKNGLDRILTAMERLKEAKGRAPEGRMSGAEEENAKKAEALTVKFESAMEDDFNTADAIAAVFELVKLSNSTINADSSQSYLSFMEARIRTLCDVMGILTERKEELLDSEIEDMIAARQAARKAKDFAKADQIRNELLERGIILEDTREGVKWKRA